MRASSVPQRKNRARHSLRQPGGEPPLGAETRLAQLAAGMVGEGAHQVRGARERRRQLGGDALGLERELHGSADLARGTGRQ